MTRQRIYLETMEHVFGGTSKVILDTKARGAPVQPSDAAQGSGKTRD
ncbi:MAG TPA: hypothetical protein VH519_15135 [Hyphomicrobiaceae bacterium]|jgi:hypothetical protein